MYIYIYIYIYIYVYIYIYIYMIYCIGFNFIRFASHLKDIEKENNLQ